MQHILTLKPGDTVEIIAPASRCLDSQLTSLVKLLESWQLRCIIPDDIFGEDPFSANTDEIRFRHLQNALMNPESKAMICARGGYGTTRLMPQLQQLNAPTVPKILVGISDVTALHLFLQQQWQWPTLHAALAPDRFSPESTNTIKSILFGEIKQMDYAHLIPLNSAAQNEQRIEASIIGGNLALLQTSAGTPWQMTTQGKILLLEDVNERGYRIDRMLEHLQQAGMLTGVKAILLGDFTLGLEADGTNLVETALERFANRCSVPVVRIKGVGHDYTNLPIVMGTQAVLTVSKSPHLTCLL